MDQTTKRWKRYALVQPPIMILIFAQASTTNIFTDLIVYRTCGITLDINKTECLLLHENASSAEALKLDKQIHPEASLIIMTCSVIESLIPALISLFLGPWSDTYGRKSILLCGYIGTSLKYFILSIMTIWDISPWFLLISSIPYSSLGGFCVILLGSICYISDISNDQEKGWQLAWMDILIYIAILAGTLVGPLIFYAFGYTVVYASATVCCILAGLYIYFIVPETIHNTDSITVKSLFNIRLIKELFTACTKKRDGFNRYIFWCCILCVILRVIVVDGEMNIGFLFTSSRLGWDVYEYSLYTAVNTVFTTFGIMFGMKILVTYGGLTQEIVIILSALSSLGSSALKSFALKSWYMYVSSVVGVLGCVAGPVIRAMISNIVPTQDSGKIFSMALFVETSLPLVAASLYNTIYSHFMPPMYPSPVFLVSVAFYIILILVVINMKIQRIKLSLVTYDTVTNNEQLTQAISQNQA